MKYSLVFITIVGMSAVASAAEQPLAKAVEVGRIEILVGADGKGSVTGYECSECPIQVVVDEGTQFKVGKKQISVEQAKRQPRSGATLVYWPTLKRAKTIQW